MPAQVPAKQVVAHPGGTRKREKRLRGEPITATQVHGGCNTSILKVTITSGTALRKRKAAPPAESPPRKGLIAMRRGTSDPEVRTRGRVRRVEAKAIQLGRVIEKEAMWGEDGQVLQWRRSSNEPGNVQREKGRDEHSNRRLRVVADGQNSGRTAVIVRGDRRRGKGIFSSSTLAGKACRLQDQ